ncbi:MAG: hypothetical protein ABUL67_01990 [Haliangium ochraceum]
MIRRPSLVLFLCGMLSAVSACAPEAAAPTTAGTGGANASGGATGAGGANATGGANASGGSPATGGAMASGGVPSTGGGTGSGGRQGTGGGAGGAPSTGGASNTGGASHTGGAGGALPKFSFFVTSLSALQTLSGNQLGFGGDLRFGETGDGAGLRGADKICTTIANMAMPGAGAKGWRAFLSAPTGGTNGGPVHAIDRIGAGPWYDRLGRLVSANKTNLVAFRPTDADPQIKNDFPNETGAPNHSDGAPGCSGNTCPDNHDTLTGSDVEGHLYVSASSPNPTCSGWTSAVGNANNKPRVGHSWPRMFGGGMMGGGGACMAGGGGGGGFGCYGHWMSSLDEGGCAPGVNLVEMGPPMMGVYTVGTGGGYGGFYCFALVP